jgi:hypothetical protein
MKLKKIIFFLIIIIFASCKKEIPASIKVKVEYENKLNKELPKLYFLWVYKNGKIYKKYSRFEKPYIEKEFIIDSLTNGKYKFIYLNLLNQTLEKTIVVKENKTYNVSINPDFSDYKKFIDKSLIKNLTENQKVEFVFKRNSCMSSSEGRMIITKKGKLFIAENHGNVKELNQKEVNLLIKMECELNLIQDGGCTTSDHYIIKSGNVIKEFYDRTCAWEGWTNTNSKLKWNIKNGS